MSMNNYPVNIVAFWIDSEVAAYINLADDRKSNTIPSKIQKLIEKQNFFDLAKKGKLPEEYNNLPDLDIIFDSCFGGAYCSSFEGNVTTLLPDRTQDPIDESFDDDYIVYIPALHQLEDLFSRAYESPEELLDEFKELFNKNHIEVPKDFDWWKHIVKIYGTTFC